MNVQHHRVRNSPVFRWWDYPIFIALTVVFVAALAFVLRYWLSLDDWSRHPFSFGLLSAVILLNIAL